jgi:predicted CopG family antitoxin
MSKNIRVSNELHSYIKAMKETDDESHDETIKRMIVSSVLMDKTNLETLKKIQSQYNAESIDEIVSELIRLLRWYEEQNE